MLSRREQIDELFLVTLNLSPEDRRTFLQSIARDEREEVLGLLAAYEGPRFPSVELDGRVLDFGQLPSHTQAPDKCSYLLDKDGDRLASGIGQTTGQVTGQTGG